MSTENYAAHLYGAAVDTPQLLPKFEEKGIDFYIIKDDFDDGIF